MHYAEQMRDVLTADPGLRNTSDGYAPRPPDRPVTKFERRGIAAGRSIHDLIFVRTLDPDSSEPVTPGLTTAPVVARIVAAISSGSSLMGTCPQPASPTWVASGNRCSARVACRGIKIRS